MQIKVSRKNFFIEELKKNFLIEREIIRKNFLNENKALRSCLNNSKIIDNLIIQIFKLISKNDKYTEKFLSICAVGGYGRKVLAPYSDLDILFLYKENSDLKRIKTTVEFILFPLWDLGFKIGYAVRNITDSILFSKKDHVIRTSMLDTRLICGSKNIYKNVMNQFKVDIKKKGFKLLESKILERKKRIVEIK